MAIANNETLKRIRQIRADAVLGKKKHYNAADRKQKYQTRIGLAVIAINVVLGSALLALVKESIPESIKWLGAFLALSAAFLSAVQSYFGFPKAAHGHRAVAGRYLEVVKLCSNTIATSADGTLPDAQLLKKLDTLTIAMSKIDADAHAFQTNGADFQKARNGTQEGEEEYTDTDLALGD